MYIVLLFLIDRDLYGIRFFVFDLTKQKLNFIRIDMTHRYKMYLKWISFIKKIFKMHILRFTWSQLKNEFVLNVNIWSAPNVTRKTSYNETNY